MKNYKSCRSYSKYIRDSTPGLFSSTFPSDNPNMCILCDSAVYEWTNVHCDAIHLSCTQITRSPSCRLALLYCRPSYHRMVILYVIATLLIILLRAVRDKICHIFYYQNRETLHCLVVLCYYVEKKKNTIDEGWPTQLILILVFHPSNLSK